MFVRKLKAGHRFGWSALFIVTCCCAQMPEIGGPVKDALALKYVDTAVGQGAEALPGQRYYVHYTGWFTDGKKFDSSRDRNVPIDFVQGKQQVILGWDLGFAGMRVGGKRRLMIPYQLAYGEKGVEGIPPKSELIFDVELVDVKDAVAQPAAIDVIVAYEEYQGKALALARTVPGEKFAGVRDLFLKMVDENRAYLALVSGAAASGASVGTGKEEVVASLAQSFADVRKAMESGRGLNRVMKVGERETTRRGAFTLLDARIAELVGQVEALTR